MTLKDAAPTQANGRGYRVETERELWRRNSREQ